MRVLHDALRPPVGYELECAVGTTFTLDLVSLLSVPLAVGRFSGGDDGPSEASPLELLAALERTADRITLFHQAGAVRRPDRHRELLTLVERCLVGVVLEPGRLFHPKLWVARYGARGLAPHHRVIVSSRNLTPDRCWDIMVVLEGAADAGLQTPSRRLGKLLRWLSQRPSVDDERRATIEGLATSVSSVRFAAPAPFESASFHPLGIGTRSSHPIAGARRDRMLVVSPFVGASELERLSHGTSESILVTRAEEYARLDGAAPPFASVLQLDEGLEPEPDLESEASQQPTLSGLHAKLFVADQGWKATVWTGSANATGAAFGANVEFLLELHGSKKACGVDAVLGDETARGAFRSMLRPIEEGALPAPDDEAERALDAAAATVASLPIEAHATSIEPTWNLDLRLTESAQLPQDVSARATPLAANVASAPLDLTGPVVATFAELADHEVSGLFVVDLRLEGLRAERTLVVRWPLVGETPDRVRALIARLVTDRERLLAFLRLLLGTGEAATLGGAPGPNEGTGSPWHATLDSTPPLELLLGALTKHPDRLDSLAKWIPDLAAAAGGDLETELLAIWEPIWQARQKLPA